MKVKDYIRKLNIKKGWSWTKKEQFILLLACDFEELLTYVKIYDDITLFNKALKQIKDKYDSISNNIANGLPYELWTYFYGDIIVPSMEKYCPTYTAEKKKRQKEFERELFEGVFDFYNDFCNGNSSEDFFNQIPHESTKPDDAFAYFKLSSNATKTDVLSAFHAKILLVHPDKGGTKEEAAECIKMKDLCLNYLNKKL